MATYLQMVDSRDCLRALVRHDTPFWQKLLTSSIVGTCVALASAYYLPHYWSLIVFVAAASAALVVSLRAQRVELRVTKLEFFTRGNLDVKFRLGQAVCASDVRRLEFREAAGSEEQPEPRGLYAVKGGGYVGLLPFVTEPEATQLIREIAEKFPSVAEFWRSESPYGANLVSLGIEKSK